MLPDNKTPAIDVSRETLEKLQTYYKLLLKWQEAINLVAHSTIEGAWNRHFLDSIQLANFIDGDVRTLIDLGTGGGFPGLVLAIVRPDIDVILVDSDSKKCEFLKTVSRETDVKVKIYDERIEKLYGRLKADMCTARALANLPKLMGHMTELGTSKGLFLKGQAWEEEITMAKREFDFEYQMTPSMTNDESVILQILFKDSVSWDNA